MEFNDVVFYLALIIGFLVAFNLGANDVANSMASAVGSKALTLRRALWIASILNFAGAVFLGSRVVATISKGIVDISAIPQPQVIMLGMVCSLLAAVLWVFLATMMKLPVSSTHSIVGALVGFGLMAVGPRVVEWSAVGGIALSWVLAPVLAALLALAVHRIIQRSILAAGQPSRAILRWVPLWIGLVGGVIVFSFLYHTAVGDWLGWGTAGAWALAAGVALASWVVGRVLARALAGRVKALGADPEHSFKDLQVFTSCYVSLAHGSNDVANALGPVMAVYILAQGQALASLSSVPWMVLIIGGLGIACGIVTLGHKVMGTVGEGITHLTHSRGFAVDFAVATSIILASSLGLPVSSSCQAVGAVTGVGAEAGLKGVNLRLVAKIMFWWVLTLPIAAGCSALLYAAGRALFL